MKQINKMQEHMAMIFIIFPTVEPHYDPLVEKLLKTLPFQHK